MDQNQYQQTTEKKNAAYYRAKARHNMKGEYLIAILAFLIAFLLGGTTEELALFEVEWKEMVEVEGSSLSTLWRSLREWIRNFAVVLNRGDVGVVFDSYPVIGEVLRAAAFSSVLTLAYALLVGTPVMLGYHRLHLNLIDDSDRSMKVLFSYFKKEIMGKAIVLRLLHTLILFACEIPMLVTYAVVFLLAKENVLPLLAAGSLRQAASVALPWVILLAVVWIATTVLRLWVIYRYKFCYMILAEYPEMRAVDALRNSAMLMKGRKWSFFCLQLSFIGWYLLSALTAFVGLIFLMPYIHTVDATYYDEIANRSAAREAEFPSLDPDDYVAEL